MKLVLCVVVHDWLSFAAAFSAAYPGLLRTDRIELSGNVFTIDACEADPQIPEAFRLAADRVDPSLDESDFIELEAHGAVIYFVSDEFDTDDRAFATAQAALTLAAMAADVGALGIKCESSGIAHHPRRWVALQADVFDAVNARRAGDLDAAITVFHTMIAAWVRMPVLSDDSVLHTVGMHLLGRPEVAVEGLTVAEAMPWLTAFGMQQTAGMSPDALRDGIGFRIRGDGPGRILRHQLDPGWYGVDELTHNPWGVWFLDA